MKVLIAILIAALAAILSQVPQLPHSFKARWQPVIDHPLHQRGSLANTFCHWYVGRCVKV